MKIKLGTGEDLTVTTKSNHNITFPNKAGTVALTSDIVSGIQSSNNTISNIIVLSQSDYEALTTKVGTTLYIVVADE